MRAQFVVQSRNTKPAAAVDIQIWGDGESQAEQQTPRPQHSAWK